MKGQINFSAWVLITAIIAIVILLIFDSTIRTYIMSNLNGLTNDLKTSSTGQFSEVTTNFTAYNCSSSCTPFPSIIYSWTINFNSVNYTEYLNDSIRVQSSSGNYSLVIYPIISSYKTLCSNATTSTSKTKTLRIKSGKNYNLYYFKC